MGLFTSLLNFLEGLFGRHRVTLTATLQSGGKPVAQQSISFFQKLSSKEQYNSLGSRTTGPDGQASLTAYLARGKYDFKATFGGSSGYNPAPPAFVLGFQVG